MDEPDFTKLAEAYASRLYVVAFRLLGNRADAQDAVQRALTKCFAARADYSPRWAASTWLYRALTNVCIDELRRRRTAVTGQAEIARAAATETVAHAPEHVDLERALARVPREARLLLALRYVDGLSYGELARIRGISVNTVKSQLARGKSIVRAALGPNGRTGRRAAGDDDRSSGRSSRAAGGTKECWR